MPHYGSFYVSSAENSDFAVFSFSKTLPIGDPKEKAAFLKEKSRNTWRRRVECTGKIYFWNFWKPEMFWWESCPTLLIKFGDFEFYEINMIMLPRHSARQNINGNNKEICDADFDFYHVFCQKMESSRHRYTVRCCVILHGLALNWYCVNNPRWLS